MKVIQYNRIKGALADHNVSNQELAKKINVTPQTVSAWCTNKKQPSIPTLYKIAKILKVDIRTLLIETKFN